MTEKLRTIRLYGRLGAAFGRVHRLSVSHPAEAIHALGVMLPGFRQFLTSAKDRGMRFAVFVGARNLEREQLADPPGSDDIRIAPILMGAKRGGIFQTILGGALIVAASIATGGLAAAFTAGAGIWGVAATVGLSMALGGVSQLLTGTQKIATSESPENTPSYVFSGIVNTQAQGGPVPAGYGEMLVGSAVISAGIYAEDQQ